MKGEEIEPSIDIQIDLNVTSYIPDEYISDSSQKIEIYQNIALCKNEENIQNVVDEIIDRYGNMPEELENLLDIARIKYLAKPHYITKIASKKTAVIFTFEQSKFNIDVMKLVDKYKNRIKFQPRSKTNDNIWNWNNQWKTNIKWCKRIFKKFISYSFTFTYLVLVIKKDYI